MSSIPPRPSNDLSGAFGAAQARATFALGQRDPKLLSNSTVRITPAETFKDGQLSQAGLNNFFGYARQDIAHFDNNRDGVLDSKELIEAFNGNSHTARVMQKALDTDQNGVIDAVEISAYIMAQDAPKQLYLNVSPGLDTTFFDIFQGIARTKDPKTPEMMRDGQATTAERIALDCIIAAAPNVAQRGLARLQTLLDLRNRYQEYLLVQQQGPIKSKL